MTAIDIFALIAGFGLAWAMGASLLVAIESRPGAWTEPGEIAWTLGCGWFAGMFLLTLWMRALSAVGIPFGMMSIGVPVAGATVALLAFVLRSKPDLGPALRSAARELGGRSLDKWARALWFAVLAWLGIRFAMLLAEVLWRPMYPWDAWTQWATKARVWFALKSMAPFVTAPEWLQAFSASVYFDAAPHYPATVPLTQVWAATLLGRWDDALVNLPWWLTGVAFGFAVYGFLARERFSAPTAIIGTWLILSLPILDVHIALAGYADLAMATYFTLAALASLRAIRTRVWSDAALGVLLLAACILIKNPGKIWVLTLIPGLVAAAFSRHGLRFAAFCLGGAMLLAVILAGGSHVVLGYRLHLDFALPWMALVDAYFAFANWHLLWYGAIAIAVLARREIFERDLAPMTLVVIAGLMFLFLGFAFSNASQWVEDQSTVNRATLHLAPLIVVWMLLACRSWQSKLSAPVPLPADVDAGARAG